jgi:nucleoside-diphosphate-sugar epimerase
LITGGAGFIGTNLAHRLLRAGCQVQIYDNLSRSGAQENLRWLRITALNGSPPVVNYGPWRVGDQRWYVSNPDKFARINGWRPKTTVENGLRRLYDWISVNRRAAPAARAAGT